MNKPVQELTTAAPSWRSYIKAARPHQWLKNGLVFLPMLAAHRMEPETFLQSLAAFAAFSLVASSAYIVNDALDLNADRVHPRKSRRPFAAGQIPVSNAPWLAAAPAAAGALIAALAGWELVLAVLGYYLLTVAYSLRLKRYIVVDICVLAALYTLRIVAGGVATGIELSVWLLAFSIFFFFSLAAVKRQAELVDMAEHGQLSTTGRGYRTNDLPIMSMVALGAGYASVVVMVLYVNSPAVLELYSQPAALWGICGVLLYWLTRTVLATHRGEMHDDPIVFATKDTVSRLCLVVILALVLAAVLL